MTEHGTSPTSHGTSGDQEPAVYLDDMGHLWSPDRDALHGFADRIGMRRSWFQDRPRLYHYDLTVRWRRQRAIAAGAVPVTSRELVRVIRESDRG